ncbi:hypothetical protein [Paraflavitalea sp. CAU 1676]|nr:hypothetical protein [Paraflavitalea sp. CAU 1676]MDF2188291.1 hypothetical protein [Paraflavitalea sp. CAU 1676]
MVNTDPYGDGWIIRIQITHPGQLKDLMSPAEYADFVKQEAAG